MTAILTGVEKTLESPLDCKEIKPINSKGNQSWIFIGRTDAETETPILWPPDLKNWLIGKDPDAGKDWRQEGTIEDGWLSSPTWWTWVWASFGSWWWTGKPGVLQSMGSQRAGHDWATELNWTLSYHEFHGTDFIRYRWQCVFGLTLNLGDGSQLLSESHSFFICKGGMMLIPASDPECISQVECQDVKVFKNSNPLGNC